MEAKVDKATCIGCGLCPTICPEAFVMDDDGKAGVIVSEIPNNSIDNAKEAYEGCPVAAISLV